MFFSGHESDSVSSTADFAQERAPLSRQKDQNKSLLEKLTREKLDSKMKLGNKQNDLSSGMGQAACSESSAPTSPLVSVFFVFIFTHIISAFGLLCVGVVVFSVIITSCPFDIILLHISLHICHDHMFYIHFGLIYCLVTLIYLTHSLCLENTLPL